MMNKLGLADMFEQYVILCRMVTKHPGRKNHRAMNYKKTNKQG